MFKPLQAISPRSVLVVLVAALAMALAARASGALAQTAGTQTVTGILSVIEGDPLGFSGPHQLKTYVVDEQDRTRWTPVTLSQTQIEQAGGLQALKNRRVTISGAPSNTTANAAPGEPAALTAQAVTLGSSGPVALTAGVSGSTPVINIMCKFADIADEPRNTAYFNSLMGNSNPGLDHYWRENSYNKVNLAGSVSTGWLMLPSPRATYVGTDANLGLLYTDCRQRAVSAGFNPSAFFMLNLMFNANLDCCAWGGTAGGERVTWMPSSGYANQTVLAHEMGHGYGLPHSNFNGGPTYDNAWDVMSGANSTDVSHPTFGAVGMHINAYHKDRLGWIPAAQKYVLPAGGTATVSLERIAQPTTSNPRMIVIPTGNGRMYTVEARRAIGYDTGAPGDAVIIHQIDPSRPEPAWVMGSNGGSGAMWTVGETFHDAATGVMVRVDLSSATGFVVTVSGVARKLTVTISGAGKVTGPGISCGSGTIRDCSEVYPQGTVVTLKAQGYVNLRIDQDWELDHWEGACSGFDLTCTVTMSAARSVKAVFIE
jgi:hypothetical protein